MFSVNLNDICFVVALPTFVEDDEKSMIFRLEKAIFIAIVALSYNIVLIAKGRTCVGW